MLAVKPTQMREQFKALCDKSGAGRRNGNSFPAKQ